MTSPIPKKPRIVHPWTTTELKRASELWSDGLTITEMSELLCRTRESVKHQTQTRRDLFPRRREPRATLARAKNPNAPIQIKMDVTPYMHRAIKAEARRRNISMNKMLREVFREVFLAKRLVPSNMKKARGRPLKHPTELDTTHKQDHQNCI